MDTVLGEIRGKLLDIDPIMAFEPSDFDVGEFSELVRTTLKASRIARILDLKRDDHDFQSDELVSCQYWVLENGMDLFIRKKSGLQFEIVACENPFKVNELIKVVKKAILQGNDLAPFLYVINSMPIKRPEFTGECVLNYLGVVISCVIRPDISSKNLVL